MNICNFCGKETINKRFCNVKCHYNWQRENGGYQKGRKKTAETINKLKKSLPRGKNHPSQSKEWRENLSKKLKGKPKSLEHRKNISKGLKGIKFSLQRRKAMSLIRKGIKRPDLSLSRIGEGNPAWKGGRTKDGNGYWVIYMPKHPYACQGKIKEHRLVIERHLGRYLKPNEIIHHIDFDKINNKIENLYLMSRGQHSKLHRDLEKKVRQMYKERLLKFDKKKGIYV